MPLYTFVMSHRGKTNIYQHRSSNYTGFLLTPIAACFPHLKPAFGELMQMKPEPIAGTQRVWTCALEVQGETFRLYVIETRD